MKNELIYSLVFLVLYFFFGNFILHDLFIKDECYYHSHEVPYYIELLFDFPSSEGYHPVATKFGYIIFGGIGFLLGGFVSKMSNKE